QHDVADTLDALQPLADIRQRVVRYVKFVEAVVGREQADEQKEVGSRLVDVDAELANLFRQAWLGGRDTVLDLNLRDIEIGADGEGHGDGQSAVAGGLRGHVDHVLDAVDRLLDRRGNRL